MSTSSPHAGITAVKAATPAASAAAADATIQAAQDVKTSTVNAAAATLLAGFVAWLVALRKLHNEWLVKQLAGRGPDADVQQAAREEMARELAFAQASAERMARALPLALSIADPIEREAKVRALLDAEQRYADQRAQAMAERAFALMERVAAKRASPAGAYWQLGIAHKHTQGCLTMAGHAWSWPILDRVHPPRHPGCVSRLLTVKAAIDAGLLERDWKPNPREELRRSAGVMMESDADEVRRECELRERLVQMGVSADRLDEIEFEGVMVSGAST